MFAFLLLAETLLDARKKLVWFRIFRIGENKERFDDDVHIC
jgi:hypothetical protein